MASLNSTSQDVANVVAGEQMRAHICRSSNCFNCGKCKTIEDVRACVYANFAAGVVPERLKNLDLWRQTYQT